MVINIVLRIVAICLIIFSFLPLVREGKWWIRIFDFPRLQVLTLSLIVLVLFAVYHNLYYMDIIIIVILLSSFLYNIYLVYPYTPLHSTHVRKVRVCSERNRLRLVSSNVLMSNRKSDAFIEMVNQIDADIILALETDPWWEKQLMLFDDPYPYSVKIPLENTYGMVLYSRLKLIEEKIEYLIDDDVPSIHTLVELPSGILVELHCVHPRPPRPDKKQDSTKRDAELMLIAKRVKSSYKPVVVVGDLNDVAWSHTTRLFRRVSGLLDPRIGRGVYNTFHAKYPLLRFPLDHVFHSFHFKLCSFNRLPYFGSDHFSIFIELVYDPDQEKRQMVRETSESYTKEADEKINEGLEA